MEKPLFSVVVIARNERETLPRLLDSLANFRAAGGQVVVMDTGSTDDTQFYAIAQNVELHEATYMRRIGEAEAVSINTAFRKGDDAPIVNPEDTYFDFAFARNNAAEFAQCDWVAMPDCDEVYTQLDIDKINAAIRNGVDQFEYNFVYSHNEDGSPQVQFRHCKFYNRRKLQWTGVIHEVLTPVGVSPEVIAAANIRREYVDFIKLEHFQNPSTNRGQYLVGLAVDCYQHRDNDRNAHYFARELMYSGRLDSAMEQFKRHIKMNAWPAERAQSMIYIGDIIMQRDTLVMTHLGETLATQFPMSALDWYFKAWNLDPGRREALIKIAEFYYKSKQPLQTTTFAEAALTIPLNDYYGNQMHHYGFYPHEMLYWAYWNLGKKTDSRIHWNMARKYAPLHSKFLHDARFFMDLPKVSIVIPHVEGTREARMARVQQLIKNNANYPNYEVVVEIDCDKQGCPKTFNRGVQRATGELIMFLGDDCEPQPDFLIQAVLSHLQFKWRQGFSPAVAVTALNDGLWNGELATHWLADADFRLHFMPCGVFLHEEYNHVGCDNELTAWAKAKRRYNYCPEARIVHVTVNDDVHVRAWDANKVAQDRALLLKRCEQYALDKKDAMCDGLAHA